MLQHPSPQHERPAVAAAARRALLDDLQRLRISAGEPSYALIAERIAKARVQRGMSPAAAKIARSSVYDALRPDRQRLNADLIAEVAAALGESPASAEAWRQRCVDTRLLDRAAAANSAAPSTTPLAPVPATGAVSPPATSLGAVSPPVAAYSAVPPAAPSFAVPRAVFVAVVLIACVGANLFGHAIVDKFQLPLWLDMIGTAVAALAFGPWQGVAVAVSTNLLGTVGGNLETLPFVVVNVTGALVWGYGYRLLTGGGGGAQAEAGTESAGGPRSRHTPGLRRMLALNVAVAVVCTTVAVPVNLLLFHGVAGHASDGFAAALVTQGVALAGSVFASNLLLSVVDKLIAGSLALAIARRLAPPAPEDPSAAHAPNAAEVPNAGEIPSAAHRPNAV